MNKLAGKIRDCTSTLPHPEATPTTLSLCIPTSPRPFAYLPCTHTVCEPHISSNSCALSEPHVRIVPTRLSSFPTLTALMLHFVSHPYTISYVVAATYLLGSLLASCLHHCLQLLEAGRKLQRGPC